MKKESFELQKRIVGLTSKNKQQQPQWDQEQRGRCLGLAFEKFVLRISLLDICMNFLVQHHQNHPHNHHHNYQVPPSPPWLLRYDHWPPMCSWQMGKSLFITISTTVTIITITCVPRANGEELVFGNETIGGGSCAALFNNQVLVDIFM